MASVMTLLLVSGSYISLLCIIVALQLSVISHLPVMSFYSPSRNIFDHSCYRHDFPEEFMRCLLRYVFFYGIYTSFLLHVVLINLTVISLRCPTSLNCPDSVQNTFTNIYEQCSISSFLFCSMNPLVLVQMVAPTPSQV